MEGGAAGALGRNTWIKQARTEDGDLPEDAAPDSPPEPRQINIGGKATVWMGKGDVLRIETPGGGAWGAPETGSDGVGKEGSDRGNGDVKGWAARGSFAERAARQAGF